MPFIITSGEQSTSGAAAFTLGTLRDKVRDIIQEQEADFWQDDELSGYLNEALVRFSHEERWSWLLTAPGPAAQAAGDPILKLSGEVPINRQFNLLITLSGTTVPYRPKRVSPSQGLNLRTKYFASGNPEWYYLAYVGPNGGTARVTLIPTPSSALNIEYTYFREPAQMVSDSDTPDMPDAYVDALVRYAAGLAWLKELNGGGKGQEQFNLYQLVLEQARKDEMAQADDSPLVVGGGDRDENWMDAEPRMPLTY